MNMDYKNQTDATDRLNVNIHNNIGTGEAQSNEKKDWSNLTKIIVAIIGAFATIVAAYLTGAKTGNFFLGGGYV